MKNPPRGRVGMDACQPANIGMAVIIIRAKNTLSADMASIYAAGRHSVKPQ